MKIGERASLLYERAAMELTSLVSGMTEFAANLYPLKTEEELVALLSGIHHFPPGVPERARRVHERLPAGSALCSSDVGVLIGRLDTEGGLGGLYKHLAHTKEGPLHLVPSITHCAVCALNGEQVPLVVKSSLGHAFPRPTVYLDGRGGVRESVLYCKWCPRCNAKHNMSYAEGGTILQRGERVLSRREAQGYGAGGVNVTIMARDAESFRQSRTQVAADIARAVSLGRRGM